ncbi:MAG: hypothetical protein K6A42_05540 [Treponema sp.]|nr:hypothetical protein [Treponema sp.]
MNCKRLLLAFALFVVVTGSVLFADDGGAYYPEDWSYGNIYVKEPNQKIALENEALCFGYQKATAIFDFNNTTNEKVLVPCSFPIVIKIPFRTSKGFVSAPSVPRGSADQDFFLRQIVLNRSLKDEEEKVSLDELKLKDKSLRVEKYSDYINELKRYGVKEDWVDKDGNQIAFYGQKILPAYSGCEIEQDGKKIPIQNVGVQVDVFINPKSELTDDWAESRNVENNSCVTLTLHFYHQLEFKPASHSKLVVSYEVSSLKNDYHANRYEAYYDISTGGTWKGSMKNFLVAPAMEMEVKNGLSAPQKIEQESLGAFYLFKNYKPAKNEYFVFKTWGSYDEGSYYGITEKDFKNQNYAGGVQASSYLKGTFTHREIKDQDSLREGNEKKSDYAPQRSFDHDPYNGWVEGVDGDGVGEWISFGLSKWCFGPFATNGLAKFPYYVDDKNYDEVPYKFWLENNRVKKMGLYNSKGFLSNLDFYDAYAGVLLNAYTVNLFQYNAVKNPRILSPDVYKMKIQEVYKGTKYSDTVLGEVWFLPIADALVNLIKEDRKSSSPIFENFLQEYFLKATSDNESYRITQDQIFSDK